jgi:hypothetical protein
MKILAFFLCFFSLCSEVQKASAQELISPNAKMFSLSPEEMVFASKLSDLNRRRFCYAFSFKERALAMAEEEGSSPDERVEKIFASQCSQKDLSQLR